MTTQFEPNPRICNALHPDKGVGCALDVGHPGGHRNHHTRPRRDWPRLATGRVSDRSWWVSLARRIAQHTDGGAS